MLRVKTAMRNAMLVEPGIELPVGTIIRKYRELAVAIWPKPHCKICTGTGKMTIVYGKTRVELDCNCVSRRFQEWRAAWELKDVKPLKTAIEQVKDEGVPVPTNPLELRKIALKKRLSTLQAEMDVILSAQNIQAQTALEKVNVLEQELAKVTLIKEGIELDSRAHAHEILERRQCIAELRSEIVALTTERENKIRILENEITDLTVKRAHCSEKTEQKDAEKTILARIAAAERDYQETRNKPPDGRRMHKKEVTIARLKSALQDLEERQASRMENGNAPAST